MILVLCVDAKPVDLAKKIEAFAQPLYVLKVFAFLAEFLLECHQPLLSEPNARIVEKLVVEIRNSKAA